VETFLWLANAGSEVEKGFGINFDILDTNLVNLAIIIGVLFYFGRGFIGGILSERRSKIETAIRESEQRAQAAKQALDEAKQKLAKAQADAKQLIADAEARAKATCEAIALESEQEVARMKEAAAAELNSDANRATRELRDRAIALALESVESELKQRMNESVQSQLVDRSISMIGG
jgi:F-type H+-transporting ATPase subunit b